MLTAHFFICLLTFFLLNWYFYKDDKEVTVASVLLSFALCLFGAVALVITVILILFDLTDKLVIYKKK